MLAAAALLVLAASGCGAGGGGDRAPRADPPGEPPGAPAAGPPPAWLETEAGPRWLGFSTYCWDGVCADYAAPRCGEEHVPTIELDKGERVRVRLGFEAEETSVTFFGTEAAEPTPGGPLEEDGSFAVPRAGPFAVFARAAGGGDASYVGCARFPDG